jgi:hypothetical protein
MMTSSSARSVSESHNLKISARVARLPGARWSLLGRAPRWQLILGFTVTACLGVAALSQAQFSSFSDRSRAGFEGNWQSCREADGQYSERVYDGKWPGMEPFEFHMGPYHEFALFRGIQSAHRDHASAENLIKPASVPVVANRAAHVWDVAGLHVEVALGGGSREECENWFVSLKRSKSTSSF